MVSAVVVSACLLGVGDATALDQPITGKKLWLRLNSTGKFVLLSKDAGIDASGFDPQCRG
jgi:hypothetical protein